MAQDKVEAVKQVSETMKNQPVQQTEELERAAPNKAQFDSLMNSNQPNNLTAFDRHKVQPLPVEEGGHSLDTTPAFGDQNVTSQKSGSSTDEQRKGQQQQDIEEIGEVRGKKTSSSQKNSSASSFMDEVGQASKTSTQGPPTLDGIKAQTKQAISQMDAVKTQLSQTKGEIKPTYQTALNNRLTHIDDELKIALSKAGVEQTPQTAATPHPDKGNPLGRFINLVSNSQYQLENLHQTIDQLQVSGKALTPANMLAIQMKMGYIQQQIELFTSLLNKALESTKTIMNVQV